MADINDYTYNTGTRVQAGRDPLKRGGRFNSVIEHLESLITSVGFKEKNPDKKGRGSGNNK